MSNLTIYFTCSMRRQFHSKPYDQVEYSLILRVGNYLKLLSCWSEFADVSANSKSASTCAHSKMNVSLVKQGVTSYLFQVGLVKRQNQTQSIRLNESWCKSCLRLSETSPHWVFSLSLQSDSTDSAASASWRRLWPQQTRLKKVIQYCLLLPRREQLLCKHSLMTNLRRTLPGKGARLWSLKEERTSSRLFRVGVAATV